MERARKILENKGMQNDERIDSLDSNIVVATTVAIDSSRKMEEASRKLAMTQVRQNCRPIIGIRRESIN